MRVLKIMVMVPNTNVECWHTYEHDVWVGEYIDPWEHYDVLIAPMDRGLGYRDQPIERYAKYTILVGEHNHEVHQYEDQGAQGRSRYTIHMEKFKSEKPLNFQNYVEGVFHSLSSDPIDIRRAVRTGEKFGSIMPGVEL